MAWMVETLYFSVITFGFPLHTQKKNEKDTCRRMKLCAYQQHGEGGWSEKNGWEQDRKRGGWAVLQRLWNGGLQTDTGKIIQVYKAWSNTVTTLTDQCGVRASGWDLVRGCRQSGWLGSYAMNREGDFPDQQGGEWELNRKLFSLLCANKACMAPILRS